jgi:hypothetical protein
LLTGVTALVRATGAKMEQKGMTYPAQDMIEVFNDSDFVHISNEVSFAENCPDPDPYQRGLVFCSKPEYFELLEYIGADVIELTGNHILDWGQGAFLYTLDLYDERGMMYYAGGHDQAEARLPLLIEHNGNHIAFIGCNAVGPPNAWASDSKPGGAACEDYEWIKDEIKDLSSKGYLPIVTLQHNEFYSLSITPAQRTDFLPLIEAGAVLVSGSQAHYPNPFGFHQEKFVHFGLGNLFFDQMDFIITAGIHYFYDGKHISTEIITLYLEDFAKPRLMTEDERAQFLREAFTASGW